MSNLSVEIALETISKRGAKVAELALYETVSCELMEFESMEEIGDGVFLIDQATSGVPYVTRFIVFIKHEDGTGYDIYIDEADLGDI